MRIRSDGPHETTVLAPSGTSATSMSFSRTFTVPWYNGQKGEIMGIPFTMGVELMQFGEYGVAPTATVEGTNFRKLVTEKLFNSIPTVTPGLCPLAPIRSSYVYDEYQDVVTPGYRARMAAGEIINNPMAQVHSQYTTPPTVVTTYSCNKQPIEHSWDTWHGRFDSSASITIGWTAMIWTATSQIMSLTHHENIVADLSSVISSPVDEAVIGAFAKLQDAHLDVAMMVAEGGETLAYLKLLLQRAMRMLKAISNPKQIFRYAPKALAYLRKTGDNAKALADAYLEARYALRPLLIDIDDTLKYLSGGKAGSKKDRYTYRKNEASQYGGQKTVVVGSQTITVDFSIEKSARAGILAKAGFDVPGSNFGFMNWASIAWEKVKYSFILGWLVDVGGLLYRLNPNVQFTPLASWATEITSVSYVASMVVGTPDGNKIVTSSGIYRKKSRNPIEGNLPPPVTIAVNFDSLKMLDLLALASQIKLR